MGILASVALACCEDSAIRPTSTTGGYEDVNMKIKIYVLYTVRADENGPAMPAVFADETEARAKYDEVMRWEWDSTMDPTPTVRIRAIPMKPKSEFAAPTLPNGAGGN